MTHIIFVFFATLPLAAAAVIFARAAAEEMRNAPPTGFGPRNANLF